MNESTLNSHKVPSLAWGISHESIAREEYLKVSDEHVDMQYLECGLFINPAYPHLGGTPDGIISCDCCGKGTLEIKCPYDQHPHAVTDSDFYLQCRANNEVKLCQNHSYYFQVQGQLAIEYCDFFCWTPVGYHLERITYDPEFFDHQSLISSS